MKRPIFRSGAAAPIRQQRGVVLFVALIAMLILTLAGVAIMRSVDASMSLAGNIAFRQSALAASDQGVNTAFTWLLDQRALAASNLWDSNLGAGYQAKVPDETDWTQATSWPTNKTVSFTGPNGNIISYRIFRLCTVEGNGSSTNNPGAINAAGSQQCNTAYGTTGTSSSNLGNSKGANSPQYQGNLLVFYRIIVRVVGPRNSTSYVQVLASLGA